MTEFHKIRLVEEGVNEQEYVKEDVEQHYEMFDFAFSTPCLNFEHLFEHCGKGGPTNAPTLLGCPMCIRTTIRYTFWHG